MSAVASPHKRRRRVELAQVIVQIMTADFSDQIARSVSGTQVPLRCMPPMTRGLYKAAFVFFNEQRNDPWLCRDSWLARKRQDRKMH